jgi:hypothetical protein
MSFQLPPKLTAKFLKRRLGACQHGAYEFERQYPKGTHITPDIIGNFSSSRLTWFASSIRRNLIHEGKRSRLVNRWSNVRRRIETIGGWHRAVAVAFAKVYNDTVRATNPPEVMARERQRIAAEKRSLAKAKASYMRLDQAWRKARRRQRELYDQRSKAADKLRAMGWEP